MFRTRRSIPCGNEHQQGANNRVAFLWFSPLRRSGQRQLALGLLSSRESARQSNGMVHAPPGNRQPTSNPSTPSQEDQDCGLCGLCPMQGQPHGFGPGGAEGPVPPAPRNSCAMPCSSRNEMASRSQLAGPGNERTGTVYCVVTAY